MTKLPNKEKYVCQKKTNKVKYYIFSIFIPFRRCSRGSLYCLAVFSLVMKSEDEKTKEKHY